MPRVRRVGINAVFLQRRMGGIETYVRRLIPALIKTAPELELELFVGPAGAEAVRDEAWLGSIELVRHPLLGRPYTRALTELTLLGWLASRRGLDVLHSVALTAPLRTRAANVLTVADVTWLRQPEPAELNTIRLWRLLVPTVARRADRVIAHSSATRVEIAEDLGVPLERIDVVAHGPGFEAPNATPEQELRDRLGLNGRRIVLSVSALKVHKNVAALVDAVPQIRRAVPEVAVVVPGNPTPLRSELELRAEQLGVADRVVFPGWVSDADLEGLYRAASCFAFPSLREGFGLPLLEAMRRGLPVACANQSAMPEVVGDAALYFDPQRPDSIAETVLRILTDAELAERLSAAGLARQRRFTWRRAAEQTLDVYDRAVAGR
jgi:glycosyltransferase involved in cell wall biosynthesis